MNLYRTIIFLSSFSILILSCQSKNKSNPSLDKINNSKPNIVIIYADDLGFGDLSLYGATEISTPNIDRIGREGIKFNNGYASSPTCTPSRYSLLSGTYPFRKKNAKILPGNAPFLFDLEKQTLPSMLKRAGYTTGICGKWHLGLGGADLDWNKEIHPSPNEIGFDYSFIMASTNDRVPSVYVRNHNVVGLDPSDPLKVSYKKNFEGEPTGKSNPEMLKIFPSKGHGHNNSIHNGISRIGYMKGGKSALFTDENIGYDYLREAKNFIVKNRDKPFFLFYSLHQPHVPRVPSTPFVGKSGLGPRGDVILEADWDVGQLLNTLDSLNLAENTIVIFSSDNGPVLNDGYQDDAVEKIGSHTPAGGLRGGKYSLFDAGTHVPFMLRWKGTVKPGVSDALVSQMDFLASFASLTKQENKSPDSENIMDALLGKSQQGRVDLVLGQGRKTSYRTVDWVMIPPHKGKKVSKLVNIETGNDEAYQLYNLKDDRAQKNNLAEKYPEKVKEMKSKLEKIETEK